MQHLDTQRPHRIFRHQRDGFGFENLLPVRLSVVEHHPGKAQIVARGGIHTATPWIDLGFLRDFEIKHAQGLIDSIAQMDFGQARTHLGRDLETGTVHAQGARDVFLKVFA